MRKFLLCLSLLMFAAPALASDVRPAFLSPYFNAEAPRGHATFRKFLLKVYDANFWSDIDDWSYNSPFALSLTYNVSISSGEFVDKTLEEMAHVTHKTEKELSFYRGPLSRVFPNVKPGDTITALHLPKKPVRFFLNGKQTGEIGDKGFAEAFFGIWLSPETSEPDFRQALLGVSG